MTPLLIYISNDTNHAEQQIKRISATFVQQERVLMLTSER